MKESRIFRCIAEVCSASFLVSVILYAATENPIYQTSMIITLILSSVAWILAGLAILGGMLKNK